MNLPDRKRRELLDNVLSEGGEGAIPSESGVLALIRREKVRRKARRRFAGTMAAAVGLIAALSLWPRTGTSPEPNASVISSSIPQPSVQAELGKVEIERIGDEELLELLENKPAALVQFPDGERRLMLVVGHLPEQP